MSRSHRPFALLAIALLATSLAACKKAPATPPPAPAPFPGAGTSTGTSTPTPPSRPPEPPVAPPVPTSGAVTADPIASASVDDINRAEYLKPAFFTYDSDMLDDGARKVLDENAQVLKKYPGWIVTIEGHCDERGSAEYNLALGDRRALAAKNYLLTLGIGAERIKTVSYGKEFPFDPGHDDGAWLKNRRAQFVVTSK
jgi:peptidoglycan-associated lipoprotein